MYELLCRHRRRFSILFTALVLAGAARFGLTPFLLVCLPLAALITWAIASRMPHHRDWIEALALSLLAFGALPFSHVGLIFVIPAGAFLAATVLQGRMWWQLPLRIGVLSSRRAQIPHTIEDLWRALVPGEGYPEEHWSGDLIDFASDPDDELTVYLRHHRPGEVPEETTVTFVEWVFERSCRYVIERSTAHGSDEAEVTVSFDPMGEAQTVVESLYDQRPLPLGVMLARWLDVAVGDEWDHLPGKVKRRRDWALVGSSAQPLSAEAG